MRKKTQKYEEKENRLDESEEESEEEEEQEEEEEEEEGEEGQCKTLHHPDTVAELTRFLSSFFFLSFSLFSFFFYI